MRRKMAMAALSMGALLALPGTALGHVFIEPTSGPAGGFVIGDFIVPHGCDGSATTEVSVQIPENVPAVTPARHPLWDLSTKEGPKERTELFGETITKGISEVTWTATEPLPDPELDALVMEIAVPDAEGETLYFPTVQKCERGETRWIQIPKEGETSDDLEEPAPELAVTAAEAEDGASDDSVSDDASGEAEGTTEEAAGEDEDDDGAPMGLAVAGLVIGGLGLITGGTALARSRRNG